MLVAAQDGSEVAFATLWRDGNPALLRYLRIVAADDAEDVAAETWVQVVRGLRGFRGDEQAWRAWVFTTARRRASDERRRRSRHPVTPLTEMAGYLEPRTEDAAVLAMENMATVGRDRGSLSLAPAPGRGDCAAGAGRPGHRDRRPHRSPQPGRGPGRRPPGAAAAGSDPDVDGSNAVTGRGVSDDDMPIFPWPAQGGIPPLGDPALDALLTGRVLAEDAPGGLRPVAEAIAALNAAPTRSELAAEASARSVFRCTFGSSAERARSRHRSRPALLSRLGSRLGAAAAVGMVALSAAAAAAYTGALPAPVQNLAHYTIGAPSGHRTAPSTQVGQEQPAATAGHRLCVTFTHLNAHRRARQKAVDFHHLAAAAGGAAHVKAYCAAAAHPGTATPGQPAHHRAGDPGSSPTPRSAGHPSGRPSPNPASWPSPLPASGPGPNPTVGPSPSPTVGPTPSPNGGPSPSPSSTGQPTSQPTGSSTAQPQRAGRPASAPHEPTAQPQKSAARVGVTG